MNKRGLFQEAGMHLITLDNPNLEPVSKISGQMIIFVFLFLFRFVFVCLQPQSRASYQAEWTSEQGAHQAYTFQPGYKNAQNAKCTQGTQ